MIKEINGMSLITALAVGCASEPAPPAQTAQDWQEPAMGTMPETTPEEPELMAGTEESPAEAAPVEKSAFERYDADGDKRITRGEIAQGAGAEMVMSAWDTDGDGAISGEELSTVFVASIDDDGDGMIDRAEYDQGAAAWMNAKTRAGVQTPGQTPGQTTPGQTAPQATPAAPPGQAQKLAAAFQAADKNRDQKLDASEAKMVFDQLKIVQTWDDDRDGKLSQVEVAPRIFAAWDQNGDGDVTDDEWKIR